MGKSKFEKQKEMIFPGLQPSEIEEREKNKRKEKKSKKKETEGRGATFDPEQEGKEPTRGEGKALQMYPQQ